MTLIKSISGIRGTIGGTINEGLTPIDTVKFASAYGSWLKLQHPNQRLKSCHWSRCKTSGQWYLLGLFNTYRTWN